MSRRSLFLFIPVLVLATVACGLGTTATMPSPTPADIAAGPTATAPPAGGEPTVPPATESAPPAATVPPPTEAAVPTAIPLALPTIVSFTADKTTIVEREEVTLSWQVVGASEVYIGWVGANSLSAGPGGPLASEGSLVVRPDGTGDIVLTARNEAGEAEAHVYLTIECAHEWVPALADDPPFGITCPWEAEVGPAAQQPFEHGFMIWLGPSREIYVFYDRAEPGHSNPSYRMYADEFHEGDPESDPTIVPPSGLYQPIRGFGLVWRTHPEVREGLGWATAPEVGFETWAQGFSASGLHNSFTMLQGIDGTIYQLTHFDSSWQVYSP